MQDKARLGTRYTCFNCGTRFYDLNRPQPLCPRCGADQDDNPAPDPRVAILSQYKASRRPAKAAPVLDDPVTEEVDEPTADLPLDDASEEI